MLSVCSMGSYGKHNAIMIGSAGKVKSIWAYVHMGSWSVYGSISNPGGKKGGKNMWICVVVVVVSNMFHFQPYLRK